MRMEGIRNGKWIEGKERGRENKKVRRNEAVKIKEEENAEEIKGRVRRQPERSKLDFRNDSGES